MKVLFLDIDGVANCASTKERFGPYIGIDPALAARVRQIVRRTGCTVVLSSSWRIDPEFRLEVMQKVTDFLYVTDNNFGKTDRGCEVKQWLEAHPEVTRYAILDDNSDFHKDQHLFKTDWHSGLTNLIAAQVIEHLNKETSNAQLT